MERAWTAEAGGVLSTRGCSAIMGGTNQSVITRSITMAPNTEAIVPQLQRDFEALIDYVTGPASASHDVIPSNSTCFAACWPWEQPCSNSSSGHGRRRDPQLPKRPTAHQCAITTAARCATSPSSATCGWRATTLPHQARRAWPRLMPP